MMGWRRTVVPAPTRVRFQIESHYEGDHYGYTRTWETTEQKSNGNALSSMLTTGEHAPVLDVDRPVTVTRDGDASIVRFSGRVWLRRSLAQHLGGLALHGLVEGWSLTRRHLLVREVAVRFPFPVVALESRSRGHHHLLVQAPMSWERASTLASLLGRAHLVDFRHARVSTGGNFQYVYQANTDHDQVAP